MFDLIAHVYLLFLFFVGLLVSYGVVRLWYWLTNKPWIDY